MKKGQAASVTGFVVFAVMIIIGTIVFSTFDKARTSIATTTSGTQVIQNITGNTYSGVNIVSIGPIVFAAVVILAVVGMLSRR